VKHPAVFQAGFALPAMPVFMMDKSHLACQGGFHCIKGPFDQRLLALFSNFFLIPIAISPKALSLEHE
jgi:hypothetical protein